MPRLDQNRSPFEHRLHQYYHETNGWLKDNKYGSIDWLNGFRGKDFSTKITRENDRKQADYHKGEAERKAE